MQLVEVAHVSHDGWREVLAGEPQPWGGVGEELVWRDKTHQLAVRDDAGNLVALAGLVLAEVRAAELRFQVAGIGGVIVTRAQRGRGLAF